MLIFVVGNHLTWSSFVGTLGARLNNMALDFAKDLGFRVSGTPPNHTGDVQPLAAFFLGEVMTLRW